MPATIPTPDTDGTDALTFAPYMPSETPTKDAKPAPTGTAMSTTKSSPTGTDTPAPVAATDDTDARITLGLLLALIITGVTAACVWIYRRHTQRDDYESE